MAKATKKTPKKAAAKKLPAPKPVEAMESAYAIEDNVPLPPRARSSNPAYPFRTLKPGQSFLVPAEIDRSIYKSDAEADKAQVEECRKIANRLSGAKRRVEKKDPSLKFAIRTVEGGVRVWRVEAPKGKAAK